MSRATKAQREAFVARMAKELHGPERSPEYVARWCGKQEAQCNGDWPADDGDRLNQYCGGTPFAEASPCGTLWRPAALKGPRKLCPGCRTRKTIEALCAEFPGVSPIFSGDPRGATVKIKVPSGYSDSWGGVGVCVPTS